MALIFSLSNPNRQPVYYKGSLCLAMSMTFDVEDSLEAEEVIGDLIESLQSDVEEIEDYFSEVWSERYATHGTFTGWDIIISWRLDV